MGTKGEKRWKKRRRKKEEEDRGEKGRNESDFLR